MTYDADALNAFSGILARTGSLTVYGLPICRLPNGPTERHDNTTAASNFVRSLMWDQARIGPQWVSLLRTGSKIVLSTKLSLGYRSESCRRRKGMPPWSWISSESSDINLLAASTEHGDCSNVCYSSKITIRHEVGNIQVAPQFILCDGFIESKMSALFTFPDTYVIRGIALKPSIRHFCHGLSDPVCSPFEVLDGISVMKSAQAEHSRERCGYLWMHVDAEADTDLAAMAAGPAVLDAVLLEVRGCQDLVLGNDLSCSLKTDGDLDSSVQSTYHFLLVCRRESQPVTRVGVLRLGLYGDSAAINPEVLSRGCVTLA